MSVKSIRHAGIVVKDLKLAIRFYCDLLGLKVVKQSEESGDYIDRVIGVKGISVTTVKLSAAKGSLIELLYFSSPDPSLGRKKGLFETGLTHIALEVEDVDKEYGQLDKAGIKFNSKPQVSPDGYAKVAFCRDYDGVLVELVQVLRE